MQSKLRSFFLEMSVREGIGENSGRRTRGVWGSDRREDTGIRGGVEKFASNSTQTW